MSDRDGRYTISSQITDILADSNIISYHIKHVIQHFGKNQQKIKVPY